MTTNLLVMSVYIVPCRNTGSTGSLIIVEGSVSFRISEHYWKTFLIRVAVLALLRFPEIIG